VCQSHSYLAKNSQRYGQCRHLHQQAIHDIDFKAKGVYDHFLMWFKYRNRDFDSGKTSKCRRQKRSTNRLQIDSSHEKVYVQMKLQCVRKIHGGLPIFPYDRRMLRTSIENSQFDSRSLVFCSWYSGPAFRSAFHAAWMEDRQLCDPPTRHKVHDETAVLGDESIAHIPK